MTSFKAFLKRYHSNDNSALIPEHWANEGLAILEENMVIGNLVHRDFEQEFAKWGDVVNSYKPAGFKTKRKSLHQNVVDQDASLSSVKVTLDQHLYVTFIIKDGEETMAMKDLVGLHLQPAVVSMASTIDSILLGQAIRFANQSTAGYLGGNTANNIKGEILGLREAMNVAKVPMQGRRLIHSPSSESLLLSVEEFTSAEKVADGGLAIREAYIGRKLGFDHYMCQNTQSTSSSTADTGTGAINNASGYAAGHIGAMVVDGITGEVPVAGSYITIAGDMTPLIVSARTGTTNTTGLTCATTPLKRAVENDAVITYYKPVVVNNADGYAAGYIGYIVLDGFTSGKFLQVGQSIAFGTGANRKVYTVIDVADASGTDQSIMLDRPLEVALSNDDNGFPAPIGSYNFGFTRDALALVVRPLAPPRAGTGALSTVINYNGLAMRVTITYDGVAQGHRVTVDFLCGVAVYDERLGGVLFG